MERQPVEIKQVSEREIWVGESRLYLGEDNILYETIVGKQDLETVIAIKDSFDKLRNLVGGKVNVLADISKSEQPTPEARKEVRIRSEEKEGYEKIALFGMHPVARVFAAFIIGPTKKESMRFFKSKEDAIAWLKE
jgi:hypothetical protein